jgi:hypothetical protein
MGFSPFSSALAKVADTGAAGYTLVNGTGTILSWTAPADGQQHMVQFSAVQHVTSAETGGAVTSSGLAPDGSAYATTVFAGGSGAGLSRALQSMQVEAGQTVTLLQSSALTAGAAVVWAQMWAA